MTQSPTSSNACNSCGASIMGYVAVCPRCGLADPLRQPAGIQSGAVSEDEAHIYEELTPGHLGRQFAVSSSIWFWVMMPLSTVVGLGWIALIFVLPVAPGLRFVLFVASIISWLVLVFVIVPKLRFLRSPFR